MVAFKLKQAPSVGLDCRAKQLIETAAWQQQRLVPWQSGWHLLWRKTRRSNRRARRSKNRRQRRLLTPRPTCLLTQRRPRPSPALGLQLLHLVPVQVMSCPDLQTASQKHMKAICMYMRGEEVMSEHVLSCCCVCCKRRVIDNDGWRLTLAVLGLRDCQECCW